MYTDWFKLRKLPFRLRPDPEFLFLDSEAGPVLEALRSAVTSGHGTLCLIGEPGTGKTTLLHALAREHQGAMPVARVQQPNLTAEEYYDLLTPQQTQKRRQQAQAEADAASGTKPGTSKPMPGCGWKLTTKSG